MKILIVEDEPLIGLGLEDEITDAGHSVLGPVSSSNAAMQLARSSKPTMALVDLDLRADQDGTELARQLQAEFHIPTMFMTFDKSRIQTSRTDALGVLMKPFALHEVREVLDVVQSLIEGGHPPPPRIPGGLHLFG